MRSQLIAAIAAAAQGNAAARQGVEELLPRLEGMNWQIAEATRRIWDGERDWQALVEELDSQDALLVKRVLEVLAGEALTPQPPLPTSREGEPGAASARDFTPQQLLAALPAALREALAYGDVAAFQQALEALPPQEQAQALAILMALQRLG